MANQRPQDDNYIMPAVKRLSSKQKAIINAVRKSDGRKPLRSGKK